MNRRNRHLYLLTLGLIAAGCGALPEKKVTTVERRWPAAAIKEVAVSEVNGSLSVTAGGTDEVVLVAKVASRGVDAKPNEENQGFFKTTVEGDRLRIGREKQRVTVQFPFSRNDLEIDYVLQVPPQVALDLQTVNGRIATRGVSGDMEATTVNGAIDIESRGTSELIAKTVNGSVRAKFTESFQGARLKTVNGRVSAYLPASASFSCDLTQVNGNFTASFPLNIHSNPGSRRVSGEVNGGKFPLKITTVNGSVKVENVEQAPVPRG